MNSDSGYGCRESAGALSDQRDGIAFASRVERALDFNAVPAGTGFPARLSTLTALARACVRQLTWGRRLVSHEIERWRAVAAGIPDERLRRHALASLRDKRNLALGAGFFSTIPDRRHATLVRLLVTYQILWDFLDSVSEDIAPDGDVKGRQLHLALVEALTPGGPISDYYLFHPGTDDAGYLSALVSACRAGCSRLPSYSRVETLVIDGVTRCSVQALNHDRDPSRREASLKRWAAGEFVGVSAMFWFELTAAASAFMPHPLLALASEPGCTDEDVASVHGAYFPWMSLAIVMLDSYVDRMDDLARGDHSYIAYYQDEPAAISRLAGIIHIMTGEMYQLRGGGRHAVVATCMVGMYLSKNYAHAAEARATTRQIVQACDGLAGLVLSVLRMSRKFRGSAGSPWRAGRNKSERAEQLSGSEKPSLRAAGRC